MSSFSLAAVVSLAILSAAPPAGADAVVAVVSEGGYEPSTLRTVRSITADALRERGVSVRDAPGLGPSVPSLAVALADAASLEADALYLLRLGRLGDKVFISLEELAPPDPSPVFTARLTAEDIDEADKVIGRLVLAVLEREPAEAGARIATVTAAESESFRKRPGEGLFILGVGLAPLGGSIGWSYEAQSWRLGVLFQGADDDVSFFGVEGAWLPYDGAVSPYLGAGLGAVGPECDCDDGVLGAKLEVGAEFFRLHGVRLIAGVNVIIPFESRHGMDSVNAGLHVRVGF